MHVLFVLRYNDMSMTTKFAVKGPKFGATRQNHVTNVFVFRLLYVDFVRPGHETRNREANIRLISTRVEEDACDLLSGIFSSHNHYGYRLRLTYCHVVQLSSS